ncbi:MAG TPA: AAA family ATPase [Cellvibrionaceae bacterium]
MQTPPVSLELEPYIPTSWRQLQRQIENLAQFGGAVQVITGAEGAGKSTFLEDLLKQASTQQGWEIWQVADEAWPGHALQKLLEALGLPVGLEQSVGESMVALRKYNQNLQRQKRRVVVAVDNADLLSDATLSGIVSVLQGGAEEGFGLHLVLFARDSLADRLDALQLIDVSVYDFVLPCLSLQELTELLNGEYEDLLTREPVQALSADTLQEIWLESQGLPGVALSLAREAWALSMGDEKRFSVRGLPLVHILLVLALISLLVWAIWMREKPTESSSTITQETSLQSINSKPLTIEMKQVTPGESSEPVKMPTGAEPANSPQQTLANYTAQANPGETTPVPQPARSNEPAATEVKNAEVNNDVAVNPNSAQSPNAPAKAEPTKESKPAEMKHTEAKPAEAKPAETKPAVTKPAEPKAPQESAKSESTSDLMKASTAKAVKPTEEVKPVETKAVVKPEDKAKLIKADVPTSIASSSKKLSKLDENAYVLQIMVTNSAKKIEDMLAGAPNKKDLAAYKTIRDGKEVYILVEGEYPSANEAAAAAKNLPSMQQSAKPWPKKVGLIHAEIKSP